MESFKKLFKGAKTAMRADPIPCLIFIMVVVGLTFGILMRNFNPSPYQVYLMGFPGEIMIRSLEGLVLPLIVFSVMSAIMAMLDSGNPLKEEMAPGTDSIGWKALVYYIFTTTTSVIIGLTLVLSIHPGNPSARPPSFIMESDDSLDLNSGGSVDVLMDVVRNLVPNNIVGATQYLHKTQITNAINGTSVRRSLRSIEGANILGLITYGVLIAVAVHQMGSCGRPVASAIHIINNIIMNILGIFMRLVPFGVFSLIASTIAEVEDLPKTAAAMSWFVATVLIGLALQFIIYLILYSIFVRRNPFTFFFNQAKSNFIAFGTSSTAATLPSNMDCAINNNKLPSRVVRFMLPIGAAVNCDGIPVYEVVATIFIAQINEMSLGAPALLELVLTTLAASVGAANVTNTGLVTMVIVFKSVGLPLEAIGWLFTFDWLLDRCRTVLTMSGDAFGAAIVSKLSGHDGILSSDFYVDGVV